MGIVTHVRTNPAAEKTNLFILFTQPTYFTIVQHM